MRVEHVAQALHHPLRAGGKANVVTEVEYPADSREPHNEEPGENEVFAQRVHPSPQSESLQQPGNERHSGRWQPADDAVYDKTNHLRQQKIATDGRQHKNKRHKIKRPAALGNLPEQCKWIFFQFSFRHYLDKASPEHSNSSIIGIKKSTSFNWLQNLHYF
jgi:hypothetical protein